MEANPDKIQAILEITPLKNIKEVKSLNGRVTVLNKFVSRMTEKCPPFFKAKESLQMDRQMSEGLRGTKDIPRVPTST